MDIVKIRPALPADATAMLDIYAPYIENTSVTFETKRPTDAAFAQRVETYQLQHPWLLCEINGVVAGYAYASAYREREAYQWSAECSVYIHPDFRRRHVAQALYTALFELLRLQDYRNVYAVINLPNPSSVALHEQLGFTWFATYEQVGYKLGQWKNVGWWRLILNGFGDNPAAPVPVSAVSPAAVEEICTSARAIIN